MDTRFIRNVLRKGLLLFLAIDLLVVVLPAGTGKLSLYNSILEGRQRFPFGENSAVSYNLSLFDMNAMFASQVIDGKPKAEDEFRVILLGDSSVWGTLLRPEETLAGMLETAGIQACEGKVMHFYNLGYPTVSLVKDLMVLDQALAYEPDLILWFITMESFPEDNQLTSPIVSNNAERVQALIEKYDLDLNPYDPALVLPSFWDKTLIGQRRALADLIRLQLYGVMWSATGIDQVYPEDYTPAQRDFDTDINYHGQEGPILDTSQLRFDLLETGIELAGDIPVLLINEPILISEGENSDLRYNFLYPRWAYDSWRSLMADRAAAEDWNYIDLWNLVPEAEFTNSGIHYTPHGVSLVVEQIEKSIRYQDCP